MSAPNQNWPRWIFASFAKHFDSKKQTVNLYIEHTDRDTAQLVDFAEFRLDGPRMTEWTAGQWKLEVTVNVLIQSTMDDRDAYKLFKTIGIMCAAFTNSISVFKYGDDSAFLTCFQQNQNEPVRINNFGIIDEVTRKQQATIECRYRAELTEP